MLKNNPPLATPFFWIISFGGALLSGACAPVFLSRTPQAVLEQTCPREDLGERPLDCPWAGWVREFEGAKARGLELPESIRISLERDREDAALREAWGLSQNFEESAGAEIVRRAILSLLAKNYGVQIEERGAKSVIHAGLIHTYGYLLSNLRTPFGFKRARWVSGRLEEGFSLPAQSLGPEAHTLSERSTLLSQVTYLAMRIAHQDQGLEWERWRARLEARATPELKSLVLPASERATEIQRLRSGESIEWVTDLVSLPRDPRGGRLLVYSLRSQGVTRVITAFPVERDFAQRKNSPVKPRYNAWVD